MRAPIAIVALGCTSALIVGCGGSSDDGADGSPATRGDEPQGTLVDGATFTYALPADPGALDPATNLTSIASRLFAFTYDRLVTTNADNEIVPNLATEWQVRPKQARFTLREGVTCADGSPVTGSVIAENLEYLKDPKVQSQALGTLDFEVEADDAGGVLTIRFGQPVAFPLYGLATVPIVCGKGLDDRGTLERETSGSGPYVLTEAVANDHYTLTLREGYRWAPDGATSDERGLPAKVTLRVAPNETTVANLLLGGELNAGEVSGAEVARLEQASLASLPGTESLSMTLFNQAPGRPAVDPAVRQALTAAINRDDIGQVAGGRAATSLVPPSLDPCADPAAAEAIPAFDPEAEAVLDDAGWTPGPDGVRVKDGQRLELTALSQTNVPRGLEAAGELVIKWWRELGADVRVKTGTDTALMQQVVQGGWDVIPLFGVTLPDPSGFIQVVSGPAPPDGTNFGHVDNARYDELVSEALATTDRDAACQLWNEAQQALYADADIVPLVERPFRYWRTDDVAFEVNSTGPIPTSVRMYEE